jgi:hypothetical protein
MVFKFGVVGVFDMGKPHPKENSNPLSSSTEPARSTPSPLGKAFFRNLFVIQQQKSY